MLYVISIESQYLHKVKIYFKKKIIKLTEALKIMKMNHLIFLKEKSDDTCQQCLTCAIMKEFEFDDKFIALLFSVKYFTVLSYLELMLLIFLSFVFFTPQPL